MCDYCGEEFGSETFSIPLDRQNRRWNGEFCCRECRLAANMYMHDPPTRPLQTSEERNAWINQLDMAAIGRVVIPAPPPGQIQRYNPHGVDRQQWAGHLNQGKQIKMRK